MVKIIRLDKHERTVCTGVWFCRRKRKVEQFKKLSGLSFCRFPKKDKTIHFARAPLSVLNISKSERRTPDGRKRKILYCIERAVF